MKVARQRKKMDLVNSWEEVPSFTSEREEAEYWLTHTLGPKLLEQMRPLHKGTLPVGPRTRPVAVRFDQFTLQRIKALAARRGKGYQTLLKEFVSERLYEEEKSEKLPGSPGSSPEVGPADRPLIVAESTQSKYRTEPIRVREFTFWSVQHIHSAAKLVATAAQLEHEAAGVPGSTNYSNTLMHYRACVTGAVFSSVAFLEAAINEVFAQSQPDAPFGRVTPDSRQAIMDAASWVLRRGGPPMLAKYQLALFLTRKHAFDEGARPYQDVDALIDLRNELIHYTPQWLDRTAPQRIVLKLWNKFPLSPFEPEELGQHLDRCISYGCARWAVESSLAFADEFFERSGLIAFYQKSVPNARSLLPLIA